MAANRDEGIANRKDPLHFFIKEDTDDEGCLTEERNY